MTQKRKACDLQLSIFIVLFRNLLAVGFHRVYLQLSLEANQSIICLDYLLLFFCRITSLLDKETFSIVVCISV